MNKGRLTQTQIILAGLCPGALAGTHIAGLIFFINPHLPFSFEPVMRGVIFYSALLAPVSLIALLLITWIRKQTMGQWFPIALTLVMVSSALMFWTHAYYFGFYLPPGINKRLLKAAVFLSLAAVIGFYTLLLHRMRRKRYGGRALGIVGLLALLSIYVVMERREAYEPRIEPSPREATFESSPRPLLCVVGIDSASFDVILPLAEQGRLPFFRRVLDEGAQALLAPLEPTRPLPLWATLGTGKYPYKHGIVGDSKFEAGFLAGVQNQPTPTLNLLPLAVGFEHWGAWGRKHPTTRSDLRVLPLWEILNRLGMSSALIGWPGTFPASEGQHLTLTNKFFQSSRHYNPQSAFPPEAAEKANLFQIAKEDLDSELLSRFGPSPPEIVLDALVQDQWRKDFATFLLDQDPATDAIFLFLPGLRSISEQYFGGYSAVQFRGIHDDESVRASHILSAYYAQTDELLGGFWDSIQQPKLLVLVSVHGVGRMTGLSEAQRLIYRQPATRGDLDDGSEGILMLLGEGVQKTENIRAAQLVDLPPTLLYGLGFPVARDSDGSVLTELYDPAFMAHRPLSFVPSYEAFSALKP